jgi:uncharacterized protein (DUF924 family)
MQRAIKEGAGSAVGFIAVLAALVAIDPRVRERFALLFEQASADGFASWRDRAADFGDIVLLALRERSLDHAPLLIFAVVAAVLVVFMLRT